MADPAPSLPLDIPDKPILSTAEVVSLAEVAAKRAEKFGTLIDTLDAGVAKRAADAAESFSRAGFQPKDQQTAADKAAAIARREVVTNSSDTRWAHLKELSAASDSLATTAQLWASPVTVLARAGLGTPERSAYQQQLDGSGVVDLKNVALLAVATNNKALGAAIVSIIDRMPARSRPFSAQDLADKLVGEETRSVQAAIAAVKLAAQRAINRNREYEAGRVRPMDRVKLALNKKDAN
ncbi:hypothetical protein [Jannaschia sp. CCS1]|uniref:hypothetical protein n=1 Tax=Jannaschia sp. (strain CCS1) TaxID=290400 RepID=UPI000053DCC9|nr:hypothetical protein [Jannaschia sp. CCS1]ABD55809.1 hypothetical protein Jann_2892 [Jannaschia sp. CCS1]